MAPHRFRRIGGRSRRWVSLGVVWLVLGTLVVFLAGPPESDRPRRASLEPAHLQRDPRPTRSPDRLAFDEAPQTQLERVDGELLLAEPSGTPRAASFPIGWYDSLLSDEDLPAIAHDGASSVMPYDTPNGDPATYLEAARAAGVQVLLEVPRRHVKAVDRAAVAHFVSMHRSHPALLGWYLADEPTVNDDLGPLGPHDATALYEAIKSVDRSHPVAIAFGGVEDPAPYRSAMDVMMFDRYPCWAGEPEFNGMASWTAGLRRAAETAETEDGFVPVIQAYAHDQNEKLLSLRRHRLPTTAEQRYMVFTALQEGATGLFFWARYRSDPAWINQVLRPIVAHLGEMRSALDGGASAGLVRVRAPDVRAVAFTDPVTSVVYIVSVHHGEGTVAAPIALRGSLAGVRTATLLSDPPQRVVVADGAIQQSLGSYAVNVYRLEP